MIVKNFNFKKGNRDRKLKKLWKQDRDQRNMLENGNKLKMKLKVCRTKINSKVFAIPILTAI